MEAGNLKYVIKGLNHDRVVQIHQQVSQAGQEVAPVKSFKHVRKGSNTLGSSLKQVRNSLKVAGKESQTHQEKLKHFRNIPKSLQKHLKY